MFDIQTELRLRRAGRDATDDSSEGRMARAILIVANLTVLSLLVAAVI